MSLVKLWRTSTSPERASRSNRNIRCSFRLARVTSQQSRRLFASIGSHTGRASISPSICLAANRWLPARRFFATTGTMSPCTKSSPTCRAAKRIAWRAERFASAGRRGCLLAWSASPTNWLEILTNSPAAVVCPIKTASKTETPSICCSQTVVCKPL